jgi:hypothetical protein
LQQGTNEVDEFLTTKELFMTSSITTPTSIAATANAVINTTSMSIKGLANSGSSKESSNSIAKGETLEEKNARLLEQKMAMFNARSGVRVGDYVRLPTIDKRQKEYTRITHLWTDTAQTGGGGSYFLSSRGFMDFSGGLDTGVFLKDLELSTETKAGAVWFITELIFWLICGFLQ